MRLVKMKGFLPIAVLFTLTLSACAGNTVSESAGGPDQQFLANCEQFDATELAARSNEKVPQDSGTGIVPYNEIRNLELFKYQIPVGDDLVRSISEICPGVLLIAFNQGRTYLYEENSEVLFEFTKLEIPQSFVAADGTDS